MKSTTLFILNLAKFARSTFTFYGYGYCISSNGLMYDWVQKVNTHIFGEYSNEEAFNYCLQATHFRPRLAGVVIRKGSFLFLQFDEWYCQYDNAVTPDGIPQLTDFNPPADDSEWMENGVGAVLGGSHGYNNGEECYRNNASISSSCFQLHTMITLFRISYLSQ